MSLNDELTETTVEDKLRRLVTFFTTTPFEEITTDFDLNSGIDKVDVDYFREMMAGALTYHFGVDTDADRLGSIGTLGDMAAYLNENGVE